MRGLPYLGLFQKEVPPVCACAGAFFGRQMNKFLLIRGYPWLPPKWRYILQIGNPKKYIVTVVVSPWLALQWGSVGCLPSLANPWNQRVESILIQVAFWLGSSSFMVPVCFVWTSATQLPSYPWICYMFLLIQIDPNWSSNFRDELPTLQDHLPYWYLDLSCWFHGVCSPLLVKHGKTVVFSWISCSSGPSSQRS